MDKNEERDLVETRHINNKQVYASKAFALARYKYTPIEMRILASIIYSKGIQDKIHAFLDYKKDKGSLRGHNYTTDKGFASLFGFPRSIDLEIPLSDFTTNPKEYKDIQNALKNIANIEKRPFEYEDKKVWKALTFIAFLEIEKENLICKFSMHKDICNLIAHVNNGFRRFEFEIICSLKSYYSMRFYMMFAHQDKYKEPNEDKEGYVTFELSELKEMFKLGDSYIENVAAFKQTIKKAKKELDEKANYSFEVEYFKGKKAYKKTEKVRFHIIHKAENEREEENKLQRQINHAIETQFPPITMQFKDYLLNELQFSDKEIYSSQANFQKAQKFFIVAFGEDFLDKGVGDKLYNMKTRYLADPNKDRNWQRYIVGTLKNTTTLQAIISEIRKGNIN